MTILVTGAAGFIGYHLCNKLLEQNESVIGFDNLNNYYDVNLKKDRIKNLTKKASEAKKIFHFIKGDLKNKDEIKGALNSKINDISTVVHLAAQAGVRHSIKDPDSYINSNIVGFLNVLEAC